MSSNVADGLREAGVLPSSWLFASGNLALIVESLAVFSISRTAAAVLFAIVLVLQLLAASLFWRAGLEPQLDSPGSKTKILQAFFAGIGLFSSFIVFDELLVIYRRVPTLETTHFVIFCALLLSLLVIHVCGDREQAT